MSTVALLRNQRYNRKVKGRDRNDGIDARRIFKALILLLSLILLLELVFHFYIAEKLTIRTITIRADASIPYTNNEIVDLAGIERGSSFFTINTDLIALKLEKLPIVREAVVSKTFPHSLEISLTERDPLTTLMVTNEEGMVPVYVDSEGVIFRMRGGAFHDLPIISGVEVPAYREGLKLPPVLTGFLTDLEKLRVDEPALYNLISEVKFVKKNRTQYEVVLYPADYPVKVRIGSVFSSELMKYIVLVLDVMAGEGMLMGVDELDFRTDEVVYRPGRE